MAILRRLIRSRKETEKLCHFSDFMFREWEHGCGLYFKDPEGNLGRHSMFMTRAELEKLRDDLDAFLGAKDEPEYSPNGIPGIDFNP